MCIRDRLAADLLHILKRDEETERDTNEHRERHTDLRQQADLLRTEDQEEERHKRHDGQQRANVEGRFLLPLFTDFLEIGEAALLSRALPAQDSICLLYTSAHRVRVLRIAQAVAKVFPCE